MESILSRFANWSLHPNKKRIFSFQDGGPQDEALLGAKAVSLCELQRLSLPVPPGCIISSDTSLEYIKCAPDLKEESFTECKLPDQLVKELKAFIYDLEILSGRKFGEGHLEEPHCVQLPLLLSVRSGASCPVHSHSKTILNLGMNDCVVKSLTNTTNEYFALDCYQRFLQMFGTTVSQIEKFCYEDIVSKLVTKSGKTSDQPLDIVDLRAIVNAFKEISMVPEDPWDQLQAAIVAYYRIWFSESCKKHRQFHELTGEKGISIIIQSMVYGNLPPASSTGICSTRHPTTGEKVLFGEFLPSSEGEEILSSPRMALPLEKLRILHPAIYDKLTVYAATLENHYKDMQDIHFTVENGRLYILKSTSGWRSSEASVRVAVELVEEGVITSREAILRVDSKKLRYFMMPCISIDVAARVDNLAIGTGLNASPGAGTGMLAFQTEKALEMAKSGKSVILCKHDLHERDYQVLQVCSGVICLSGGQMSQSALLARHAGIPAVVGVGYCQSLHSCGERCSTRRESDCSCGCYMIVDLENESLFCRDGSSFKSGDIVTIDGSRGNIFSGEIEKTDNSLNNNFRTLLQWAIQSKHMKIMVDSNSIEYSRKAFSLGADGIGLWRTEALLLDSDNINTIRLLLLSGDVQERQKLLDSLFVRYRDLHLANMRQLRNCHVVFNIVDPSASEIFPKIAAPENGAIVEYCAHGLRLSPVDCLKRLRSLFETEGNWNARSTHLLRNFPQLAEMQFRAILAAACMASLEGIALGLEILLPWAATDEEIIAMIKKFQDISQLVYQEYDTKVHYGIGCMLEVPRACINSEIVQEGNLVDFVAINSDVLTEMIFGVKRTEFAKSVQGKSAAMDPFKRIDEATVGSMIKMAVQRCRHVSPTSKVGISGQHTGDSHSIAFFDKLGVDFLTCACMDVPTAVVASSQSHIMKMQNRSKLVTTFGKFGLSRSTVG